MAEEVAMNMEGQDAQSTGFKEPKIKRGRVDSLTLYEITDNELEILEKGSPNSTHFSFSIFFLSIGVSFLISLLTTDLVDRMFTIFLVVTILGLSIGAILFVVWWRTKGEVVGVCKKIRQRMAE